MNTQTYSYKDIFKVQEENLKHISNTYIHCYKLDAFDEFLKQGIPTRNHEDWKYTNVSTFTRASLNPSFFPEINQSIKKSDFKYYEHIKAHKLVVVNGSFQKHLSEIIDDEESDVTICSVNCAIESKNPIFEKYFNNIVEEKNAFTALNTAMFGDGVFIHLKKNCKAKYPIIWIFVSKDNSNFIVNPRNLIVIEENSTVSIIKDHQGISETDYFLNSVTEINIESSSVLDMTVIHNETSNGLHLIGSKYIKQSKDSVFNYTSISLSGKLIRNNIYCILNDMNAECNIRGIYYGKQNDLIDNFINVVHNAQNCRSNQLFKGILDNSSNGIFTGKIFVSDKAINTKAYQKNDNLLLSDEATFHSRPQLEIYTDEVKCSHGATNGQIDLNTLYYLQSRGLSREVALSLLEYGFMAEVIEYIKNPNIKSYIEEIFRFKLGMMNY